MLKLFDSQGRLRFIWKDGDAAPTEIKLEDEEQEEDDGKEESDEETQEV